MKHSPGHNLTAPIRVQLGMLAVPQEHLHLLLGACVKREVRLWKLDETAEGDANTFKY